MFLPWLLSLLKREPRTEGAEKPADKKTEKVSPEAVMATVLLKAHLERKPVDIEGISGLFFFNSAVKNLTASSDIALRRVSSGGMPGRGVYSEDVNQFVGRFCAIGYARESGNGCAELLPDGLRLCFLILVDEAKANPTGLDALAAVLDFKISVLLRCFDEKWLRG